MRTSKIMGVVAAGLFALTLGAQQAGATMNPPTAGISQVGNNSNSTSQSADSTAKTVQKNFNTPLSIFSVGSNWGGVKQYNDAGTKATSSNWNGTSQSLDQHQTVVPPKDDHGHKPPNHKSDCDKGRGPKSYDKGWDKGHDKGCKPECDKDRSDRSYSEGHDEGCKPAPKPDCDKSRGDKPHGDKPYGNQPKGPQPVRNVSQSAGNDNHTSQNATSEATTKQFNVNAPISVFSVGSNNGDVKQGNDASTSARSSNENGTSQGLDQHQSVEGRGNGDVSQDGRNSNSTSQNASSEATTKQVNINAPISVFSVGSNNGDVKQSNDADTKASSTNQNWTDQSLDQHQQVDGNGSSKPGHDYGRYGRSDANNGSSHDGDISQSGKNENSTNQNAESTAKTEQKNVNVPISLFSVGSNGGDVHQGNSANTQASSSNQNGTQQWLGQTQLVGGLLG
jgi:hypothetical protein